MTVVTYGDHRNVARLRTRVPAKRVEHSGSQPGPEAAGLSDGQLLEQAAAGDAGAFSSLVSRHLPAMLGVARRMLRDDAEAEDVAQEAMLRLWRSGARLEVSEHGVRPWLRRVVSNLCIDRVRSGRNTSVTDEVPEQAAPADQVSSLERQEASVRVEAALKQLPDRQRLALVLFHYEGLSQIEIGQTMGISDEAVESLLSRARRSLKTVLASEWRDLLTAPDD
jgi:RNA polymerase sigma-70 factor, ECF subfamily